MSDAAPPDPAGTSASTPIENASGYETPGASATDMVRAIATRDHKLFIRSRLLGVCEGQDDWAISCDRNPVHHDDRRKTSTTEENTFFTDGDTLVADVSHRIERNQLIVTATVENRSPKPITFVDHPDYCSIAVYAADRQKDESINGGAFLHYHRATADNLKIVPPGGSFKYERGFIVRSKDGGPIEIEDFPQFEEMKSFMRISDDTLQAVFRYGKYPDRLPEDSDGKGHNYLMVNIGARELFRRPDHEAQHAFEDGADQPATAVESNAE